MSSGGAVGPIVRAESVRGEVCWSLDEPAPSSIAIELVSDALPEGNRTDVVRIDHCVDASGTDRVSTLMGRGHQPSGDSLAAD
jgi:hypothetical protein